jgi:hypothetical protein
MCSFSSIAAFSLLAVLGAGCAVESSASQVPLLPQVSIDPGVPLGATPGRGVGLFLQYDIGGRWTLSTTCDTAVTGSACAFTVEVAGQLLGEVGGEDLGPNDRISLEGDTLVRWDAETTLGSPVLHFRASPGASIELDCRLDGAAQPRFVYLVSDGQILHGVPGNPVEIVPSHP